MTTRRVVLGLLAAFGGALLLTAIFLQYRHPDFTWSQLSGMLGCG